MLLTGAVWAAAKLAYYGELLPTAFHSKSVLRPYYSQGLVYLGLYLAKSWFLPASALALLAWRWRRRGAAPRRPRDPGPALFAGAAALYLLYVVHVGGDFMFARRILPVVPLLLLALEEELQRALPARAQLPATAAVVLAAALPYPLYALHAERTARIRGVADEPRFYTERVIELRRLQADVVGAALAGSGARVMFEGGMCVFGYYSGLPYLAEMTGLTHYSLARLPLAERGWIGHEKRATDAWLTEHDIHLVVSQRFPPVPQPAAGDGLDLVRFGDVALARIHRYDPEVMRALGRAPGVSFVPIERVLARRRAEIARATPARAREILAWLERYYLRGAGEAAREEARALRALVEARGG